MREELKGHLDLLLLVAVEAEPLHGYGIIRALRERSGGVFELQEGTVYPALHRLEKAGLLQSRWSRVDGRRRRVYRLSKAGREALAARAAGWEQFSGGMAGVLAGVRWTSAS